MTVFVGSPGDKSLSYGDPDDHISGMGGNDTIYTGAGNDTLFGGDGNDIVSGDDDNDLIHGDDGHDVLSGGRGDDLMFGGDGNDTFLNAAGNDTCYGGAGDDYVTSVFWNDRAVLEIRTAAPGMTTSFSRRGATASLTAATARPMPCACSGRVIRPRCLR